MLGKNLLLLPVKLNSGFASKCRTICTTVKPSRLLKRQSTNKNFTRGGAGARVGYRCNPPEDPIISTMADVGGVIFWTFQFYMAYHHGHELVSGEDLDVSALTDAQLGIEE